MHEAGEAQSWPLPQSALLISPISHAPLLNSDQDQVSSCASEAWHCARPVQPHRYLIVVYTLYQDATMNNDKAVAMGMHWRSTSNNQSTAPQSLLGLPGQPSQPTQKVYPTKVDSQLMEGPIYGRFWACALTSTDLARRCG